jgi:hypothetical protein
MPAPSGGLLRAGLGLKPSGATFLILDVHRRSSAGLTSGAAQAGSATATR